MSHTTTSGETQETFVVGVWLALRIQRTAGANTSAASRRRRVEKRAQIAWKARERRGESGRKAGEARRQTSGQRRQKRAQSAANSAAQGTVHTSTCLAARARVTTASNLIRHWYCVYYLTITAIYSRICRRTHRLRLLWHRSRLRQWHRRLCQPWPLLRQCPKLFVLFYLVHFVIFADVFFSII